MNLLSFSTRMFAAGALAFAVSTTASAQIELTTNGDFETGDTTGWSPFVNPPATFGVSGDAASGAFAGEIVNTNEGANELVKQANIGVGVVTPFEDLIIEFDAKADLGPGGVIFVEFFSELSGGGTSGGGIVQVINTSSSVYESYMIPVTTSSDVSGGVTLQFVAATGAFSGSTASVLIDNVSVKTIPEPTSAALIGLGGIALMARRRRKA